MTPDLVIGIDAGTSVIKAVAFEAGGRQLAMAKRPNSYRTLPGGGVEQDMERTWIDTRAVLAELVERVPNLPARAIALAVTGQGDGTWLIDAEGRPVHDGWLWLDGRAATEAREIAASDGMATIFARTGTSVNVCQMRSQLRWIERHAPELLDRADTAFHCKDWLYFRLTGVRATDPTEGVFTFGDFRTRGYDRQVIEALGLSRHSRLLPPIVDGACESHTLVADDTGLPAGLPVCLGYVDVMCTALGGGLHDREVKPGLSVIGSTGMHMRFAEDAGAVRLPVACSGYTMPFPGAAYAQMQSNMAATINIDWWLDLGRELLEAVGSPRSRGELLEGLDDRILAARPGAAIFHPYISTAGERGPFIDPDARASVTGLDAGVGFFDLGRGIFEGLAFSARDCYAAMGPMPAEVRISGGAARSRAARRILAAALGVPIRGVDREEAGAAGAVMIAAVQQGLYPDMYAACAEWVDPLVGPAEAPDPELARLYDGLFDVYRQTREALAPTWGALAEHRRAFA